MAIRRKYFIQEEHISFCWIVELTNGVCGKCIEIDGVCTNYIITIEGYVYNIKTELRLKPFIGKCNPYMAVNIQLGAKGKYKTVNIHRLLALAYIPNILNKPVVNHIDGNKYNLNITNLEWTTYSENNTHAIKTGLRKPNIIDSEKCHLTQYTKKDVEFVCDLLEKGYSPRYIAKIYPELKYDFANHIYKRHTWRSLSSDRDFSRVIKYNKNFTPEEILQMYNMFDSGMGVKDVINNMGFEYNTRVYGNVKTIERQFKNHREGQHKPL